MSKQLFVLLALLGTYACFLQVPEAVAQKQKLVKPDRSVGQAVADSAKPEVKPAKQPKAAVNRGVFSSLDSALTKPDSVKSLILKSQNLTSLPAEVSKFANLTLIDLSLNHFTEIPEALLTLPKLTAIDLSSNRVTSIPKSISTAAKLSRLILKFNEIDTVPAEITRCANLTQLDLTANPIISMPLGELSRMPKLRTIGLGGYGLPPKK